MPIQNSFHFSIQLKPSFPSTLQRLRPYGLYGSATCKSILNNFFLRIFQHIDLSAEVHLAGPRVKILERSILIGNFYIKGLRTLLIKGTLLPKTTFHFQKKNVAQLQVILLPAEAGPLCHFIWISHVLLTSCFDR